MKEKDGFIEGQIKILKVLINLDRRKRSFTLFRKRKTSKICRFLVAFKLSKS